VSCLEIVEESGQKNVEKTVSPKQYIALMAQLDKLKSQYADVVGRLSKLEQIYGHTASLEPQELRVIPEEQAIIQVEAYIVDHQGALTSDIICDLGLDPDLVLQVLDRLQQDKRVRGENVE